MNTKPPTRTLPKLVMKEWPEPLYEQTEKLTPVERELGKNWDTPQGKRILGLLNGKSLSDFTRVVEETGILDQKEAHRTKQESKHD